MKNLQQHFLGETRSERLVTLSLFAQVFLFAVADVTDLVIYFINEHRININTVNFGYYLTSLIGYIYLMDAFKYKNNLQLKFYIAWICFYALRDVSIMLIFWKSISDSITPSSLVIIIIEALIMLVTVPIQIFYLRRVIHDCVWHGFRFTGADIQRQQLWRSFQNFYVFLKLTGILFLPLYFRILVGDEYMIIKDKFRLPLFLLLTVISMLAMIGFIICGLICSKRESKLGMVFYFLLLLITIATNALFVLGWITSYETLMGYYGVIIVLWCLVLLFYSVRIVINFDKGLLDLFKIDAASPCSDLGDDEIDVKLRKDSVVKP